MNKPNNSLMKTCTSCGQSKPLSAFLQLTGSAGSSYGTICSTCRKANPDKTKEPDDLSSNSTGNKIDAKVRVKDAIDKREQHKQIEDEYFDEREKEEAVETQRYEKETVRKEEKQKIEARSFLDRNKKVSTAHVPEKVFGGEDHRMKEEKLDFATGPFQDTRIEGKIKYQSTVWTSFRAANRNAPISQQSVTPQEKNQQNQKENIEKKATTEFVQEKFSPPGSTRRR